ncbi:hypothetical protein [Sphingomonas mollis]|uniref:Colicin transporter n=1 Tax=Sphingomonas mollis TaxID=2795726 RepID=A0ABS0XKQ6_9SPHN|nr:hypothetical protein [Sphingomonas sp. BT553]MBJ6120628.1 hypothetical protein [Sphingomonas sp. BT553]
MTAAYRLRGIGWFGGCVAIVLGFYLVSLQVAGERKKLEQVNRRITVAERDIRALETEFDTRANLAQLEKWNGDTLALSAPTAGQFVSDEAQLASLDVTAPMGGATVRTAALVVPAGAAPAQPAAMTLVAANTPPPVAAPAVQRAIATVAIAPTRSTEMSVARRAAVAAVAKVRPEAVALLDRKLLSDTTLGDILSGARAEAGRKR